MGDLTVASSKNIPTDFSVIAVNVEGEECMTHVLFVPIGTINPTVDGAIDEALEQVPTADALTDVAIYHERWSALLFGRSCVNVNGHAISTR